MKSIKSLTKILFSFSSNSKIPRPRDPSIAESFETTIPAEQVQILLDPRGFMSEEEKAYEAKNTPV